MAASWRQKLAAHEPVGAARSAAKGIAISTLQASALLPTRAFQSAFQAARRPPGPHWASYCAPAALTTNW